MFDRLWFRCVLAVVIGIVLLSSPAGATSRNYVYVGSSGGQIYGVNVDSGEVRFLTTSTVASSYINLLERYKKPLVPNS